MTSRLLVLTACFVAAATFIASASRTEPVPARTPFSSFPTELGRWQGQPNMPFSDEIMRALRVDDYVNRVYLAADKSAVGLYIGYYRSQREGDTIHSPLNCLPGSGWEPVTRVRQTIDVQPGGPIEVNRLVIQKGVERQAVVYWYQSHGRIVASEYWGRAYLALDALRLNRTDGALVRVVVPIDDRRADGDAVANETATEFVRTVFPVLPRFLPE